MYHEYQNRIEIGGTEAHNRTFLKYVLGYQCLFYNCNFKAGYNFVKCKTVSCTAGYSLKKIPDGEEQTI